MAGPALLEEIKRTVLHALHLDAKGRMVPFGGYDMPVQYEGVLAEHRWTREHAGLFDVSHMGPARVVLTAPTGNAEADWAKIASIAERLVCGDIAGLQPGRLRYSLLLNHTGGVVDDLMIGRFPKGAPQDSFSLVVKAGTKEGDFARFEAAAAGEARVERMDACGLIALQGPEAAAVLAAIIPESAGLVFMQFTGATWNGHWITVARSGYTGEDGFEILVPPAAAPDFWKALLADERVKPIGLGARDSLRLEAGLPLYGHDLDETTSPVEANLNFAVSKRRREAKDFPGAERIVSEFIGAPSRLRVGLRLSPGGAPAREGAEVVSTDGEPLGKITSGGPSPSLGYGVAMAYLPPEYREPGKAVTVLVRGKPVSAETVAMPFHPHRYVRKP
ncbi:glycine cleavage system aminomethyltransferase GcvT [soil metagenome]